MSAESVVSPYEVGRPVDPIGASVRGATQKLAQHAVALRRGGDDEDVHQLRVAARRLRSDLKTFASASIRPEVASVRHELGWLGRTAGGTRDADVLTARLRRYAGEVLVDPEDTAAAHLLLERLEAQRASGADDVLAALSDDRYARLMERLDALGHGLTPSVADAETADGADLTDALERTARGFLRAAYRVGASGSDEQLHRIRLRAKRLRYAAEAVGEGNEAVKVVRRAAARIQNVLGNHQDTVVAETWLRQSAVALPHTGVAAGLLIGAARAERAECRNAWARGTEVRRIAKSLRFVASS